MEGLSYHQKLFSHVKGVFSFSPTSTIRLGRKSMRFPIVLKNNGTDPAYSVSLKLELPDDLQLLRVHIENVRIYSYDCSEVYLDQTSVMELFAEIVNDLSSIVDVDSVLDTPLLFL